MPEYDIVDYYDFWGNLEGNDIFKIGSNWDNLILGKSIKFRDWIVDPENNIYKIFPNGREYWIENSRLMEENWVAHINTKGEWDMESFVKAYYFALERLGYNTYKLSYT